MNHIRKFNESNETKKDITSHLSQQELDMIERGKEHWKSMEVLKEEGGYITSDVVKELIDLIVENVWVNAENYYRK